MSRLVSGVVSVHVFESVESRHSFEVPCRGRRLVCSAGRRGLVSCRESEMRLQYYQAALFVCLLAGAVPVQARKTDDGPAFAGLGRNGLDFSFRVVPKILRSRCWR